MVNETQSKLDIDLVDSVAHGEQFASLRALEASFFLQQSDDQSTSVIGVTLVRINDCDAVLRISPERVCSDHRSRESVN